MTSTFSEPLSSPAASCKKSSLPRGATRTSRRREPRRAKSLARAFAVRSYRRALVVPSRKSRRARRRRQPFSRKSLACRCRREPRRAIFGYPNRAIECSRKLVIALKPIRYSISSISVFFARFSSKKQEIEYRSVLDSTSNFPHAVTRTQIVFPSLVLLRHLVAPGQSERRKMQQGKCSQEMQPGAHAYNGCAINEKEGGMPSSSLNDAEATATTSAQRRRSRRKAG